MSFGNSKALPRDAPGGTMFADHPRARPEPFTFQQRAGMSIFDDEIHHNQRDLALGRLHPQRRKAPDPRSEIAHIEEIAERLRHLRENWNLKGNNITREGRSKRLILDIEQALRAFEECNDEAEVENAALLQPPPPQTTYHLEADRDRRPYRRVSFASSSHSGFVPRQNSEDKPDPKAPERSGHHPPTQEQTRSTLRNTGMPSFVDNQSRSPHENDSHGGENSSSFDLVGAYVNPQAPQAPQDITFHLEIEATEDLEDDLESFSRLRRLGQFTAAVNHFRRRLLNSLDNTYVLVQYGQFLLESSAVNGLSQPAEKFSAKQYNTHLAVDDEWFMILLRASILTCDPLPALVSRRDRSTVSRYLLQASWPRLDSTEIQVLYHTLKVSEQHSDNVGTMCDLDQVYIHLVTEDRIWDFRDLCYGLLEVLSLDQSLDYLFGRRAAFNSDRAEVVIGRIRQDWDTSIDEGTSLALLDIFTALSMSALDDFDSLSSHTQSQDKHCSLSHASTYLKVAQHYAAEVRNQNPANLKSRPYLQWVLAKFRLQQSKKPAAGHLALLEHLRKLPGETAWRYGMFPFRHLTVYVPRADEAPAWKLESFVSEEEHEATRMVHKVATELGDIQLQAACLQLMIYSASDPTDYLDALGNLWLSVGNHDGYIRSKLYCYILKGSAAARKKLFHEILCAREPWDAELLEIQLEILGALSQGMQQKAEFRRRSAWLYHQRRREGTPNHTGYPDLETQSNYEVSDTKYSSESSENDWDAFPEASYSPGKFRRNEMGRAPDREATTRQWLHDASKAKNEIPSSRFETKSGEETVTEKKFGPSEFQAKKKGVMPTRNYGTNRGKVAHDINHDNNHKQTVGSSHEPTPGEVTEKDEGKHKSV